MQNFGELKVRGFLLALLLFGLVCWVPLYFLYVAEPQWITGLPIQPSLGSRQPWIEALGRRVDQLADAVGDLAASVAQVNAPDYGSDIPDHGRCPGDR